ncbi:MAG: ABC transporter permease [Herpetosiphon sp.]
MATFLIRRVFQMLVVLLLSSIVIYGILSLVPGGPLDALLQVTDPRERPSADDIERAKKYMGLDKPVALQYVTWLTGDTFMDRIGFPQFKGERRGVLRGDFGTSWKLERNQPVLSMITRRLPDTLRLMVTSLLIAVVLALPIGIFSAVRQYSRLDYFWTTFSFVGTALPSFWFALMLIALVLTLQRNSHYHMPTGDILAIKPYSMPLIGAITPKSLTDRAVHLLMPVTVLTMLNLAGYSRFMRGSMLEVLKQDYVRTARAKGLHARSVIFKHAFRNALIPLITIVVYTIPAVFAGALVTEQVFNYKALGFLYISALGQQDWPIVSAFLLIQAALIVIANLIADVLYTVADPRIRFD